MQLNGLANLSSITREPARRVWFLRVGARSAREGTAQQALRVDSPPVFPRSGLEPHREPSREPREPFRSDQSLNRRIRKRVRRSAPGPNNMGEGSGQELGFVPGHNFRAVAAPISGAYRRGQNWALYQGTTFSRAVRELKENGL